MYRTTHVHPRTDSALGYMGYGNVASELYIVIVLLGEDVLIHAVGVPSGLMYRTTHVHPRTDPAWGTWVMEM